ncbi:MAG: hypothetical protein ABIT04_05010 [Novosphingobium sp.]
MKPVTGGALAAGGALVGALAMYLLAPHAAEPAGAEPAAAEAPEAADGAVHLEAEAVKQAGIRTIALVTAAQQGASIGYARALDLAPLAAIASDILTAQAAADASTREQHRLERLSAADDSASRREVEASRAQGATDRAKLTLACQRVSLEFGAGLSRLGCAAMPGLVREAAAGQAVLLRIDIPATPLFAGAAVEVGEGASAARVAVLGPAAAGDAQLQTAGVLALLRGRAAAQAQVGRVLPARAGTGAVRSGVLVPREAIVRADGGLFAYRATGKDGFIRVPLEGGAVSDGGWFVPAGALKPGDRIVVSGAGTLLGLEHAAPAEAE